VNPVPAANPSAGPLRIAVVGHTNTGKTSLLRTLMRDPEFGEVSDRPATTRQVEGAVLTVRGRGLAELYDTPGLEDSISLLDHLDALRGADRRMDGPELMQKFLHESQGQPGGTFAQEAKAIRQVMASHAALYVIDARDRVLGKHRDELTILAFCGRPVVPVLNFIASPEAQMQAWRDHLSRAGLHAVAEFDTVVIDDQSERRLLETMRTLLDGHRESIDALIEDRATHRKNLLRASTALIAEMLVDVAAFRVSIPLESDVRSSREVARLRQLVRHREQRCVRELLELHHFRPGDVQAGELPVVDGQWGTDLFSPAALKQFGVRTGSAAAAGAIAGLTIDAMVGGMTLGAATVLGAGIGGTLGLAQTHGRRLFDRLRGFSEFSPDDNTLTLLIARESTLVRALLQRGHASMKPIAMEAPAKNPTASFPRSRTMKDALDEVRLHPEWSALDDRTTGSGMMSPGRSMVIDRLIDEIVQQFAGKASKAHFAGDSK